MFLSIIILVWLVVISWGLWVAYNKLIDLHTHADAYDRHFLVLFRRLDIRLDEINAKLDRIIDPKPQTPSSVSLHIRGQSDMSLLFDVTLPPWPPTPNDIAMGRLEVIVAGRAAISVDVPAEGEPLTVSHEGFIGNHGDMVNLRFKYIDHVGNKSAYSEADVELIDTIPPAAPGALYLVVTGQSFDSPPSETTTEGPEATSTLPPETTPDPASPTTTPAPSTTDSPGGPTTTAFP